MALLGLFTNLDVADLKARRNVKGLVKALRYKKDKMVRREAAMALGAIRDESAVDPLIVALKTDKTKAVRTAAAEALGKLGDAKAIAPLRNALRDEVPSVRSTAERWLERFERLERLKYLEAEARGVDDPQGIGFPDHELLRNVPRDSTGRRFLDPCVICAVAGEGGMGVVFRAFHKNLRMDVAVKVLDPRRVGLGNVGFERFRREAQVAAAIDCPNVVRVFDLRESAGVQYIIMEFVDGLNAREWVRTRGVFSPAEAAFVGWQAANGLAAAHGLGVVHRDMKPDNVLISQTGQVKVSDLGLVNVGLRGSSGGLPEDQWRTRPMTLTLAGGLLGTPFYMAPEQWQQEGSVSATTDVWALGATMYFLLSGKDPNVSGEPVGRCDRAFPKVRDLIPAVPRTLASAIARATQQRPEDRYNTMEDFGKDLRRVQGS